MKKSFGNVVRPNPTGDWPQIDPSSYIDKTAQVIGKVKIGYGVFIGPNSVIRADETNDSDLVEPIIIGPECNIQDAVIIHAIAGSRVRIWQRTSLAHGSIVHGPCILSSNCFVGFRAVLYNVRITNGVFVGHGAVVCNVNLPPHSLVPTGITIQTSEQVEKLAKTGSAEKKFAQKIVATNNSLAMEYLAQNI